MSKNSKRKYIVFRTKFEITIEQIRILQLQLKLAILLLLNILYIIEI